ncbi:MAG TPA: arylamine N-acetyltransferase, partial [Pseudomonadales bacterium]|nr:arylamine N-acetyltransferase [Pseudomonadales bacterium]
MPPHAPGLSDDLVERVLARLGLSARPPASADGLATLYDAWCRNVPFDNVQKLIHLHARAPGPLPGDEPGDFLETWLACGTGGTCWAGNGALQAVLSALGFQASRGIGTMLAVPDAAPNHGTVVVDCEDRRYIVDASILHGVPLALEADTSVAAADRPWGVAAARRDG